MTAVQNVSHAKLVDPSPLTPETLRRLDDLRGLVTNGLISALLEAQALVDLDDCPDVQAAGGIVAVASERLNLTRGHVSKRLTIGFGLVLPLGIARVCDASVTDLEVLYYAAREARGSRLSASDALECVRGCNREQALTALNVPQDERRPLSGRYTRPTCESWQRALDRARTLGFSGEQTVERLAVMLLEARLFWPRGKSSAFGPK